MYVCLDQTSVWANQAKTNTDLTGEGAPVSMYTGKVRVNSSMPVPVSDSVPSDQSCFMNCPPSYWLLAETGKMPRLGLWTLQMFTVCQVSADQLMNIRFVPSLDFFFFLSTQSWLSWHQNVAHEKSICRRRMEIHARLGRSFHSEGHLTNKLLLLYILYDYISCKYVQIRT